MKLKVLLTGATGMVGEGVLHECLQHEQVERILVINRRSCGVQHPKLEEIIHEDFFDITPIADKLAGYTTCFFCLGVSSVGMKESDYHRLTYTLTLSFAETLVKGFDDVYSTTVIQRTSYTYDEIVFDAKFVTMYHESEDGKTTILELDKLSSYRKLHNDEH